MDASQQASPTPIPVSTVGASPLSSPPLGNLRPLAVIVLASATFMAVLVYVALGICGVL